MKRNNLAKRFGIASLCLATAISAVSGFALLDDEKQVEATAASPVTLLTADAAATVSYEDGLRISSDAAYEATLNQTFSQGDDTTLKFLFPETFANGDVWTGKFTVRVTDVDDATNYFDVVYYPNYTKQTDTETYPTGYSKCWTCISVLYNGMYRAHHNYQKTIYTYIGNVNAITAPALLSHYQNGKSAEPNKAAYEGRLTFSTDANGVLSIRTNSCSASSSTSQYTVAAFDGTYDATAEKLGVVYGTDDNVMGGSYGLPKLTFKNGYKLSFLSDFTTDGVEDHATDVCIKEITSGTTTDDYRTYDNAETLTISPRGSEYAAVSVGDELTLPTATYGENNAAVEKVQVTSPNGATSDVASGEKYKVVAEGVHTVTYTTTAGSVAAFSFKATEYIAAKDLVSASATPTQTTEGVRISSDVAYSGSFNTVFNGDATLKFTFPETVDETVTTTVTNNDGSTSEKQVPTWWYGDFVVRVSDAMDASKYFEIVYSADSTGYKYTGAWVQYNGVKYTSKFYNSETDWRNTYIGGDYAIAAPAFRSWYGSYGDTAAYNTREGILQFVWTDDVLSVQVNKCNGSDATAVRTIAAFDGTSTFAAGTSWGLPKMNFANGYKISFSSSFDTKDTNGNVVADHATDVLFTSLTTDGVTYDFTKENFEKSDAMNAYDTLQTIGTNAHLFAEVTGATTTAANDVMTVNAVAGTPYSGQLAGTVNGTSTLEFTFPHAYTQSNAGEAWKTFTYSIHAASGEKAFDVVYRSDGDNTQVYVVYGEEIRYYCKAIGTEYYGYTLPSEDEGYYAPSLGYDDAKGVYGKLKIQLGSDEIVRIFAQSYYNGFSGMVEVAAFDGTTKPTTDVVAVADFTGWGLPNIYDELKDGYTVRFATDNADAYSTFPVAFKSFKTMEYENTFTIKANGNVTTQTVSYLSSVTLPDAPATESGKVFLGWLDTVSGDLYGAGSSAKNVRGANSVFEPLVLSYDTINGASVRIDTSVGGRSGIRFQTLFDVEEYAAVEQYIQSFGTLVAWTDTLTTAGKEFTIENYDGVSSFAKVENTKGTFEYTDKENNVYTAYSMALEVNEGNYTKAYSARGYLVVEYADGSTQTIYTDYDATVNSRSIQQVAQNLKTYGEDEYNGMTAAQQAIIDAYANATAQ